MKRLCVRVCVCVCVCVFVCVCLCVCVLFLFPKHRDARWTDVDAFAQTNSNMPQKAKPSDLEDMFTSLHAATWYLNITHLNDTFWKASIPLGRTFIWFWQLTVMGTFSVWHKQRLFVPSTAFWESLTWIEMLPYPVFTWQWALTSDTKTQQNEWKECLSKVHHQKGGHGCYISGLYRLHFLQPKLIVCV